MRRRIIFVLVPLLVIGALAGAAYWHFEAPKPVAAAATYKTPEEQNDIYVRFVMEAYDLIEQNYWQQATDAELANLFDLSLQKAASATSTPTATDRATVASELGASFDAQKDDTTREQLAVGILQVALYNLSPAGRDELLSSAAQQQVQQTVANVNPNADLYSDLGASASSTEAQIQAAYSQKETELGASSSPAAAQALAQAKYAADVLSNPTDKQRYDTTQAQPTIFTHVFGTTLYVDVDKMSPTTAQDFEDALESASTTPLSSLIIDVRGNIGGSLEQVPNMLGLFLGKNSYVFDLYHQGDFQPIRSSVDTMPGIDRFGEIAVLTDDMTQSSAEVFAAAMKRFHLATVVGDTTRGWGTVENTYPLKTSIDPSASTNYALLLVYALTLREDNQPIEGTGVTPDVSIKDASWQSELQKYFRSASIISAVEKTVTQPPMQ